MTEEDLEETFVQEMQAFSQRPPVSLLLSPTQAWVLFSQLQLALRHPANTGPSSDIARDVAERLQARLPLAPAMATIAARGWQSEYDTGEADR